MKKTMREILYDDVAHSYKKPDKAKDWPPSSLVEFINWLQSILSDVSPEYRQAVQVKITGHVGNCGDLDTRLFIFYSRLETEEEEQEREKQEAEEKIIFLRDKVITRYSAPERRILLDLLKKECGE